eukprot:TRINITY_DN30097_c0_g1_i1.p1 TRINITY_DN30097_c0_g1~~TRINITY_DN30097_c0_g1_i1.p1  ORF type:complete len:643 (-),score=134.22 TRINITY_DN30097_c0_g1_i1:137-2065(-)
MSATVTNGDRQPPQRLSYKRARVIRTAKDSDERLKHVGVVGLGADASDGAQDSCVFIHPESPAGSHPFLGFGGSFTEASADVFDRMSPAKQEEILQAYFDPVDGLGYELGRIHIASCDFSHGKWTCGDLTPDDVTLEAFSIERYVASILPMYRRAAAVKGGSFTLVASPWSPPPWMKTLPQWNGNASLKPEYYACWALHFVKFIRAMRDADVDIWGITVQNEPEAAQVWESCIYSAAQEVTFVRDHLGPTLEAEGLSDVKIMIWDHNRDGMFERAAAAYSDPEAEKYIWGCAYHWYGDARFETWPNRYELRFEDRQREGHSTLELRARAGFDNVRKVAALRPNKHILFTEGCQELSGRPLESVLGKWQYGERYGSNIINDLESGTEGWIDWNLILNEIGGPNHVGNYCVAPIICDTRTGELHYQTAFWYLGHFSKFIRPGARKVLCSTSRDVLEVVAFMNTDGTLAVVVMNQSDEEVEFWLKLPSAALETQAMARSITTYVLDDSMDGVDENLLKTRISKVTLQTSHGTFLKATMGHEEDGPVVQTASSWAGWETFRRVQKDDDPFCFLKTFHGSWLSVDGSGHVTTADTPGENERFVFEPTEDGRCRVRTCSSTYLSTSGAEAGQAVVTSQLEKAELFRLL